MFVYFPEYQKSLNVKYGSDRTIDNNSANPTTESAFNKLESHSTITTKIVSAMDCCRERGTIPRFCLGFCKVRATWERSMFVMPGRCNEYLDDIKGCIANEKKNKLVTSSGSIFKVLVCYQISKN